MKRRIRAGQWLTFGVALFMGAAAAKGDRLRNVEFGAPLPTFQRSSLDGQDIAFDRTSGKVLLLVYLSAHQTQSENALTSAHAVAAAVGSPDLNLVYMTADVDQPGYFRDLRRQGGVTAPLALDNGHTVYGKLGLIVFPTTVVSSKDGKLLHVLSGWTRDYEYRLEAFCRHALGTMTDSVLAQHLKRSPQAKDEARARANRHRAAAGVLRSKGMLREAVLELEAALTVDPANAAAVVELADALVAQGKVDEAEARLKALLETNPDVHDAPLIQGLIHLKRKEYEPAERLLRQALLMNPEPVRVHYYLGQLYEQKEDYKLAMEHYREALKKSMKEP